MLETLRGDVLNVLLLFLLYTLQGIPLGLSAAIPMILQKHGATYKQQAEFSFVQWPFSLKLLWAPIVDTFFWRRFGRRKSWLIPAQYLIGLTMILLGYTLDAYLKPDETTGSINVFPLVVAFFFLNFLAATQDVAVDGWALTMLQKRNIGYASTCNSVGQTFGHFCGFVLLMALESKDLCNWFRTVPAVNGFVTLSGFIQFWGYVFLLTTTLVFFLKKERLEPISGSGGNKGKYRHLEDLKNSYRSLYDILRLPAIRSLALVVITAKIGFAANDAITGLKLIEGGIPFEKLAMIAVPLIPLQVLLPILLAKQTNGPRPMDVYVKAFPFRLMFNFVAAFLIIVTPHIVTKDTADGNGHGHVPFYFYLFVIVGYAVHQVFLFGMYVASMSFYAKISDPRVGGTYMTLLNTLTNLGGNWPSTLALALVDFFTVKICSVPENGRHHPCYSIDEKKTCETLHGTCLTTFDGFHTLNIICTIVGFVSFQFWAKKTIMRLQSLDEDNWKITRQKSTKRK